MKEFNKDHANPQGRRKKDPDWLSKLALLSLEERIKTENLNTDRFLARFFAVMDCIAVKGPLAEEILSLKNAIIRHREDIIIKGLYGR